MSLGRLALLNCRRASRTDGYAAYVVQCSDPDRASDNRQAIASRRRRVGPI
jgi:hypothetical protein